MTNEIEKMIAERAALDQRIAEARQGQLKGAIAQVHQIMADHGLSMADIGGKGGKTVKAAKSGGSGNKVAPKYKNPATGATWTGRGKPPLWIAGQSRDQFLI